MGNSEEAPQPKSSRLRRLWALRRLEHLTGRDRQVLRVLLIVLFWNWLISLGKLVVGALTGRITIVADGLHSLLDGANNCIGVVAILLAARPPDEEHPYGHRKFENVAAMFIGGMIVLIAWEVLDNIIGTFWRGWKYGGLERGDAGGSDPLFIGILVASAAVNIMVSLYEARRGKRLTSALLSADARHTMSDSAVTLFSIVSLLLGGYYWWIDPVLALGVLFFLIKAAWSIMSENLPAFTDRVQLDPAHVSRIVENIGGVHRTYGVRSHGTATDVHLDLSIVIDKQMTAEEAEALEKTVRRALREEFPNLTLIGIHHRTEEAKE